MSSEKNKRLVLDFLAYHLADPQWVEEYVHDEFAMAYEADPQTFPRAAMPPLSKENLLAFGETARRIWGTGEGAVRQTPYNGLVAEGDRVAVQVLVTGTDSDGKELRNRTSYFLQIKDGRIYRIWLHEDTAYIMATWSSEVEDLDCNRVE
ncbi:nuclear transport factor 2 family protein [Streptomyces sp. NPDC090499]|uniref:nuclear transport factor 2 family protein n=1 Tax=unclassified Streptomyces TaxID=2593676 RepID=UPI00381A3676